MKSTPIPSEVVNEVIDAFGIYPAGRATIRELVKIVNDIEGITGEEFIRMEMGVPGLDPTFVGTEAEMIALRQGVASKYPNIEGIPPLKAEAARFVKLFMDVDVEPKHCVPTVGSMMGSMAAFMVVNRSDRHRTGTLFLDPGFPVQKQQCLVLGHEFGSFDLYDFRGRKLRQKMEEEIERGHYSSILYSNPNNPSWICLSDEELRIIGEISKKHDVTVIEDLAYFGMDFRKDFSTPGVPPYQPSVAKYTDNYLLLISSSKAFSYAGQRIGVIVMSPGLFDRKYPDLRRYYSSDKFGHAMIYGALYALSAGASHTAQYALAAIFKAVNDGSYNYISEVREYGEKAKIMKALFLKYGFKIVYDMDLDEPIADGFYFTISYMGFDGFRLVHELLYYGISAISLAITGSTRTEGLRACVSQVRRDQFPVLEQRLKRFQEDHSIPE
ncbi:MAG: pyridoxal phosphate-dependent aminotransferase [Bacteroidales bacterium]|nr:pyridoxal phosphate-dependent aminotransferase [Bacteroidales bacterium]